MAAKSAAPKKAKGNRSFIGLIAVLLVGGAGVIAYVVMNPKPVPVKIVDPANLPAPKGPVMGSDSAKVEIVMFGDFECPGCGQFARLTEPDVRTKLVNTGIARFRYMDYPIGAHPSTLFAHNAAACANAQGKFWEMHDLIYAGQLEWSEFLNRKNMNAPKIMKRYAKELGLDTKAFDLCLDSREFQAQILANAQDGQKAGVGGTPTFIIGKRLFGTVAYDVIKANVDSALADLAKAAPATKAPAQKKPTN